MLCIAYMWWMYIRPSVIFNCNFRTLRYVWKIKKKMKQLSWMPFGNKIANFYASYGGDVFAFFGQHNVSCLVLCFFFYFNGFTETSFNEYKKIPERYPKNWHFGRLGIVVAANYNQPLILSAPNGLIINISHKLMAIMRQSLRCYNRNGRTSFWFTFVISSRSCHFSKHVNLYIL